MSAHFRPKIISGGQTGVDRAALDWAVHFGFPVGGICPRGRRAEDGEIPDKYSFLVESQRRDYAERTVANVKASDFTLIIAPNMRWSAGTTFTHHLCMEHLPGKWKHLASGGEAHWWLHETQVLNDRAERMMNAKIINVAGPRASKWTFGDIETWLVLNEIFSPGDPRDPKVVEIAKRTARAGQDVKAHIADERERYVTAGLSTRLLETLVCDAVMERL